MASRTRIVLGRRKTYYYRPRTTKPTESGHWQVVTKLDLNQVKTAYAILAAATFLALCIINSIVAWTMQKPVSPAETTLITATIAAILTLAFAHEGCLNEKEEVYTRNKRS